MLWANEKKRFLRALLLGLLLIALLGPWAFDVVNVPAEFPCSDPYVRLEGDFCGEAMSGMWILGRMTGMVAELFNGPPVSEVLRSFVFPVPLLLPIISSLLLVLRGDRVYLLVFHSLVLILAIATILLTGLLSYPRFSWILWGVWLYVGTAAGALILEGVILARRRIPG